MKNNDKIIYFILIIVFISAMAFLIRSESSKNYKGLQMLGYISDQLSFGARHVGTEGRVKTQKYIKNQLVNDGVEVLTQSWSDNSGQALENIIGRVNPNAKNRIIIGAHYDSQSSARRNKPNSPVPGANDSASGVAVLLEIAKIQTKDIPANIGADLVFFDAEEYQPGDFYNWNPKGSTYFAKNLSDLYGSGKPTQAIIIDMVCDKNLNIKKEYLSDKNAKMQTEKIWSIGSKTNQYAFSPEVTPEIKDDHTPLVGAGIPSTLIIDFDYPHFHTTNDTIDKCSAQSLQTVFTTIDSYIKSLDK